MKLRLVSAVCLIASCAFAAGPVTVEAGAMAMRGPEYEGASDFRNALLPMCAMRGDGWWLGPSQLGSTFGAGISTPRERPWVLLGEVGYTMPRLEHRSPHLYGMGDRPGDPWLAGGVERNFGAFQFKVGGKAGLRTEAGLQSFAQASHRSRVGHWLVAEQLTLTFATRKNLAHDFALPTAAANAREAHFLAGHSGLDLQDLGSYAPSTGGVRDVRFSVAFLRPLGHDTTLLILVNGTRLADDAADSPLVRKRAWVAGGVGISRRFKLGS